MRLKVLPVAAAAGLVALSSLPVTAIFIRSGERVPMKRLLDNVSQHIREKPKDARGYYTLGRLHSLAYAGDEEGTHVVLNDPAKNTPLPLPEFGPATTVRVSRREEQKLVSSSQWKHLEQSLKSYRTAVRLAPKQALYWMGLGWMHEQAARHVAEGGKSAVYRSDALKAYRKAFALAKPGDLKKESFSANGDDDAVSQESGEGILRLLSQRTQTAAEQKERLTVQAHVEEMKKKPRWITPIVIGGRNGRLADLLATKRTVQFDLAGVGEKETWPWVKPGTGILVWDPMQTGRITSGTQLFGSRTWQMIWRDGYEPLAVLDDNRDGALTGTELTGLAVWYDRNGNAVSDGREVVPVQHVGIVSITVRSSGRMDGVPAATEGLRLRDGSTLPTYDWTPRSIGNRGTDQLPFSRSSRAKRSRQAQ